MSEARLICDFCSAPSPEHRIQVRSFVVDDVVPVTHGMTSVGDFLACNVCFHIIESGDREGLITRARQSFIRREEHWDENCNKELRRFYEQFWEHKV